MYTPFTCLRMTAYQSMLASRSPRTGCQGNTGTPFSGTTPAATSWRSVAT